MCFSEKQEIFYQPRRLSCRQGRSSLQFLQKVANAGRIIQKLQDRKHKGRVQEDLRQGEPAPSSVASFRMEPADQNGLPAKRGSAVRHEVRYRSDTVLIRGCDPKVLDQDRSEGARQQGTGIRKAAVLCKAVRKRKTARSSASVAGEHAAVLLCCSVWDIVPCPCGRSLRWKALPAA